MNQILKLAVVAYKPSHPYPSLVNWNPVMHEQLKLPGVFSQSCKQR